MRVTNGIQAVALSAVLAIAGCGGAEGDGHASDPTPAGDPTPEMQSPEDMQNYAAEQAKNRPGQTTGPGN